MKQMRSRFRLITFLLTCGLLLTILLCAGSVLRAAGISLPSFSAVPSPEDAPSSSPGPSLSPEESPSPAPAESVSPEPDSAPVPEYNLFGL